MSTRSHNRYTLFDRAPYTARWRAVRPDGAGLFPDAVTDTTVRRKMAAKRRLPMLRRMRQAAIRCGSTGHLVMLTVSVAGQLHNREDHRAARLEVAALVTGWPAWFTLERARRGQLHIHILTVWEAVPALPDHVHGVPVYDLRGVLAYLSKPRDALACRSNRRRAVSLPEVEQASERYLAARAANGGRVPVGSGALNVPRRRRVPAVIGAPLLLACLLSVLRLDVDRAAAYAAALEQKRHRNVPRRRQAPHIHAPRCVPVPGLPLTFRRLAVVGHARPPPQRQRRGWKPSPRLAPLRSTVTVERLRLPPDHRAPMRRTRREACLT